MNLALFDFDGTITDKDCYSAFIRYAVHPRRLLWGKIILSPLIIGYKLGWLPGRVIRSSISKLGFWALDYQKIDAQAQRFYQDFLSQVIRAPIMEKIRWHKQQGDKVVVVSASLDIYLKYWCFEHQLDLICSELESRDGKLTGNYLKGDCSGEQKAERIKQRYQLNQYPLIYAYGDTKEDHAMLRLAHKKYYRGQAVEDLDSLLKS